MGMQSSPAKSWDIQYGVLRASRGTGDFVISSGRFCPRDPRVVMRSPIPHRDYPSNCPCTRWMADIL